MRPTRPLLRALPLDEYQHCPTHEEVHARQVMKIDELQAALEDLYRDVATRVEARRKRAVGEHNRRTGVQPINFSRGDFVLVRRVENRGDKLN